MTRALLSPPLCRAVSAYTGIVRSLEECLPATCEPPVFRFVSEVARGEALLGDPLDHLIGTGGAGVTRDEAAAAAVGEAVERYSATFVPHEQLVVASARELGVQAIAPSRFALFSESQYEQPGFPFRRFDADTRIPWVRGHSLPDHREAWLPAELVFLGDAIGGGETRIGYATSSGMACADAVERALVRALCELLERDAFMILWANRLSLPVLEYADDPRLAELDGRFFAPTGMRYAAIDLSVFHRLPTVLGIVRGPAGHPGAFGIGAGTSADIDRAFFKALAEAFQSRAAGATLTLLA